MNVDTWKEDIELFRDKLAQLLIQVRIDDDYTNGKPWDERRDIRNKYEAARKKLEGKITYRMNKIAALNGPPKHKDIFGQVFAIGQRVAWSSSSKYAGARLGWVVGITPKMISVAHTYGDVVAFNPDAYGTALMPKALIICDAIVASLESNDE